MWHADWTNSTSGSGRPSDVRTPNLLCWAESPLVKKLILTVYVYDRILTVTTLSEIGEGCNVDWPENGMLYLPTPFLLGTMSTLLLMMPVNLFLHFIINRKQDPEILELKFGKDSFPTWKEHSKVFWHRTMSSDLEVLPFISIVSHSLHSINKLQ